MEVGTLFLVLFASLGGGALHEFVAATRQLFSSSSAAEHPTKTQERKWTLSLVVLGVCFLGVHSFVSWTTALLVLPAVAGCMSLSHYPARPVRKLVRVISESTTRLIDVTKRGRPLLAAPDSVTARMRQALAIAQQLNIPEKPNAAFCQIMMKTMGWAFARKDAIPQEIDAIRMRLNGKGADAESPTGRMLLTNQLKVLLSEQMQVNSQLHSVETLVDTILQIAEVEEDPARQASMITHAIMDAVTPIDSRSRGAEGELELGDRFTSTVAAGANGSAAKASV